MHIQSSASVKLICCFLISLYFTCTCFGQRDSLSCKSKQHIVHTTGAITLSSSFILLNELWYQNYPRSKMHSFNDNNEWLQVDKFGHAFTTYTLTSQINNLCKWSCMPRNKGLLYSSSASMLYTTTIELLDGMSRDWGFSWGDMLANSSGILVYGVQEKVWEEQRITLKFSYTPSPFASMNPEVLGRNFQQRILKDYNAQTYWASFNVHRFLASDASFPRWLNVAIGYGATKMTTSKNAVDDVNNFQREREFYFSFDADLNRVRWKKKWMRRTAQVLSFIKIPGPTIEIREGGKLKLHGLFF